MEMVDGLREAAAKQSAYNVISQINEQQKLEETAKLASNEQPAQITEG